MFSDLPTALLVSMKRAEFIAVPIMRVVIETAAAIAGKRGDSTFTYNARKDEPELLRHVNAALGKLGDALPNRHSVFESNVVLNGSLKSVSKAKLTTGIYRDRLNALIAGLIHGRPDCARIMKARHGLTSRQTIDSASAETILAAYETVAVGALNVEDFGFYRATCNAKTSTYGNAYRADYRATLAKSETERGTYVITFAKREAAFAKTGKRAAKRAAAIVAKREAQAKTKTEAKTDSTSK